MKYFLLLVQEREVKIPASVWEVAARAAAAPPLPPLLSVVLHGKFDCKMRNFSCFTPKALSDMNYFLACPPIIQSLALQTSATLLATAEENLSFPSRLCESNNDYADIDIPRDILMKNFDDSIVAIVENIYPAFMDNYKSFDYLKSRVILASTIEIVDQINNHILDMMLIKRLLSSNSVDCSEIHGNSIIDVLTLEFFKSLITSGLPSHVIKLNVGTPIMFMRNIDQSEGLCNRTRLIVTKMTNHVLEAEIMGGKGHDKIIYIPRMDMSPL
ncbi:uncharacterized protein LOC131650913 [Vicia villosa]|uniref:uncharacterized protein LOC131650913 n=1 Tax=Vicia villosa TaxID=3911 RepID=UPI00273C4489|nr:uncharacterized protein LOC131650913 [Vicia villosa]